MPRRHELNKVLLNLSITVSRDFFAPSGCHDVISGHSLDPMHDRPSVPVPKIERVAKRVM